MSLPRSASKYMDFMYVHNQSSKQYIFKLVDHKDEIMQLFPQCEFILNDGYLGYFNYFLDMHQEKCQLGVFEFTKFMYDYPIESMIYLFAWMQYQWDALMGYLKLNSTDVTGAEDNATANSICATAKPVYEEVVVKDINNVDWQTNNNRA